MGAEVGSRWGRAGEKDRTNDRARWSNKCLVWVGEHKNIKITSDGVKRRIRHARPKVALEQARQPPDVILNGVLKLRQSVSKQHRKTRNKVAQFSQVPNNAEGY